MNKNISVLLPCSFITWKQYKVSKVSLKVYVFMKYMANDSVRLQTVSKTIFNITSPGVQIVLLQKIKVKVKWSHYRPGVAQRVGRGIALLFHDRVTRKGWVVSSTPRPHFIPGKELVPILQEAGWAPGPVWTGAKSRPHRDSIPDRPARSSVAVPTELPDPLFQKIYSLF